LDTPHSSLDHLTQLLVLLVGELIGGAALFFHSAEEVRSRICSSLISQLRPKVCCNARSDAAHCQ